VRIAVGMLRRTLNAMRRVESKQSVSERLVNEHARTSTRGVGEEEERSRAVSIGEYSPTHATTADPSSAYAGGCLDDSDRSMPLFGLCLRLRHDRGTTRHCRGACATVIRG
jgi:hypothetical protein